MLWNEIKNIKSDKKELKKFAFSVGGVLLLIAAALFFFGKNSWMIFGSIGGLLIALGLAVPELLKPLQKIWMALVLVLGFFMSRVILSLIFYLVLTPIGLIAKLTGKKFLELEISKDRKSYWNYRERKKYNPKNTERQF